MILLNQLSENFPQDENLEQGCFDIYDEGNELDGIELDYELKIDIFNLWIWYYDLKKENFY